MFLADVPGFMIGTEVERQGIIRHGAKMITAVSEAVSYTHLDVYKRQPSWLPIIGSRSLPSS